MNLLLKEDVTFITKLSEAEVKKRLHLSVEDKEFYEHSFYGFSKQRRYRGESTGNTFEIEPRISNWSGPTDIGMPLHHISGTIINDVSGVKINMKMKINVGRAVILFVIAFGFMFIAGINIYLFSPLSFNSVFFLELAFLPIVYISILLAFRLACSLSKKYLKKIFEAENIKQ